MEISAVIITHNESDRLTGALESLKGVCDEIVVVDSFSNDDTADLARAYGARVFLRVFSDYSSQKNYANSLAACPWILSIDADERLSPELAEEILALKNADKGVVGAYRISRKTWYLGRFITHSGWYPDRKLRLFEKSQAHWQGIIHERLLFNGQAADLKGDLIHYTYRDISDHVMRSNRYSSMLAREMAGTGSVLLITKALFSPAITFLRHYFFKLGFLDGFPGLVIALISAQGTALKYLKALANKSEVHSAGAKR